MGLFSCYYSAFMTDDVLHDIINKTLYGTAEGRRAQLIRQLIARYFGKNGLVIFSFILTIFLSYLLINEIKEFRRYKRKCRLYENGLIKNFYDIYDDYVPVPLWRRIKNLFVKLEKKHRYPTKREMRRKLRQYEKNNLN